MAENNTLDPPDWGEPDLPIKKRPKDIGGPDLPIYSKNIGGPDLPIYPGVSPADRIRQGFAATRIEDRSAPGYPGAFLYSGSAFDPRENKMLGVPLDDRVTPTIWRQTPAYSQAMADRLGSRDLDRLSDEQALAFVKKVLRQ